MPTVRFGLRACFQPAILFRGVLAATVISLVPVEFARCRLSAQGTAAAARPANASGITGVSRGGPTLEKPPGDQGGQAVAYGLGLVIQVAPRTAAVLCNVRTVGTGHWDFEDGTDMIVFDDLAAIARQKRVVVARNEECRSPATGKKRIAVTYPGNIGFVPLGAKRPDGTAYPDAGTGFGFSVALCYDLNDQGYFTMYQTPVERRYVVHQFAYDGQDFRVVKTEKKSAVAPLKTADGAWTITEPGMSAAIADGNDLLLAACANDGKREAAGVSRWRRERGDWRPVAFHAISGGAEPSLVRDVDGSLLYSVRGEGEEGQAVRICALSRQRTKVGSGPARPEAASKRSGDSQPSRRRYAVRRGESPGQLPREDSTFGR